MLHPNKTMLVVKKDGKVLARIPALQANAENRIADYARQHGSVEIDYEQDDMADLLSGLMGPPRRIA